jgi:hypothetical protein
MTCVETALATGIRRARLMSSAISCSKPRGHLRTRVSHDTLQA